MLLGQKRTNLEVDSAQKLKFGDDITNEEITINSKIENLYKSKEKLMRVRMVGMKYL